MPLLCPAGFDTCTTSLARRERLRELNTDGVYHNPLFLDSIDVIMKLDASPGYFAQTLNNSIKIEATATRRAGLERFTFPSGSKPYFVLDLANDLPASFAGGTMNIDPQQGRVTIGGFWGSR